VAEAQDVRADGWDLPSGGGLAGDGEQTNPAPERRPWSRARRRVVTGVAVSLAVVLAVTLGPLGYEVLQQKDADIQTPPTIAGLTLDRSPQAKDTTDYLAAALSAGVDLDRTVAAVYLQPNDKAASVVFFGGTGLLWSPDKELTKLFNLLSDTAGGVEQIRSVPAGPLGGVMKCGTTPDDDSTQMTVCGWADHGSVAVAMFPQRTVAQASTLMGQMRTAMERRR
jgi:hypothetical protein